MANSRVLVGVSFVGTTLAAVIALFWFWNRRDPDKTDVKKKATSSRARPVSVQVENSAENGIPVPTRPSLSGVTSENASTKTEDADTERESQSVVSQVVDQYTPVHFQEIRTEFVSPVRSVSGLHSVPDISISETEDHALQLGKEKTLKVPVEKNEAEVNQNEIVELSEDAVKNPENQVQSTTDTETSDVGAIINQRLSPLEESSDNQEVADAGVSRNRDSCDIDRDRCSHVTEAKCTPNKSKTPSESAVCEHNILPSDISQVSKQPPLSSTSSQITGVISSDKTDPLISQNNERTETSRTNMSDNIVECSPESNPVSVSEVLIPDSEAVHEAESSQVEPESSISTENFPIKICPIDHSSELAASRTVTNLSTTSIETSQESETDIGVTVSKSNTCGLQISISPDSLETSPAPELKSVSNVTESNSSDSAASENTCTEESAHKGDNSELLATDEGAAECTDSVQGSDVTVDVKCEENVEKAAEDDCDKNIDGGVHDREPSLSTESGLSRDSLEPLDSSSQTSALNEEDSEPTRDDDSGLPLTPTDTQAKGEETVEKSEAPVNNCDNTSEASNDSGKGASVGETVGLPQQPELSLYQFDFPTELCGRLIGRHGKHINYMKEKTGTNVTLWNNPFSQEFQICTIEGLPHEIEETLSMIRQKFPKSRFPNLQLTPNNVSPDPPVVLPDLQMNLPHGVSVDVIVSSIVNAGLVFLQQPTHPTFPSLERLNQFMLACYTQDQSVPQLPKPVESGVICAAPVMDGWYRALVVDLTEDGEECDVKFVDYGGYSRLPVDHLRQIRSDFMTLPFQAVECYMANVTPIQGEMYFNNDGASVLEELTQGKLLQAQVVGRAEDGIPFVHIYQVSGNKALFVNREMVNRGVARWIEQL